MDEKLVILPLRPPTITPRQARAAKRRKQKELDNKLKERDNKLKECFAEMSGNNAEKIIRVMSMMDCTMLQLMNQYFTSSDRNDTRAALFYGNGGPKSIMDLWDKNIRNTDAKNSFRGTIMKIASNIAREEINRAKNAACFKTPSPTFTRQKAVDFSLETLSKDLHSKAPHLMFMLGQMTSVSKSNGRSHNGTPKQVVEVFCRSGLSVSPKTIDRTLETLGKDSMKRAQEAMRTKHCSLVYDNINFALRKSDQRSNNADNFESGTAGTLIRGEDPGLPDLRTDQEIFAEYQPKDLRISSADNAHADLVFRNIFSEVLHRRVESFKGSMLPAPTILPLPLEKTETFPLPTLPINQSSVDGNISVLEEYCRQLKLEPKWFNDKQILTLGDLLTTLRLRGAKMARRDDTDSFNRIDWAIPVPQLFHLQMSFAGTILSTHYGDKNEAGSLAYNAEMLNRKRVSINKFDFHAVNELLRHTFDAMVLRFWQVELGVEDLNAFGETHNQKELSDMVSERIPRFISRCLDPEQRCQFDVASRNSFIFLRDTAFYLELANAIKAGDVGRIESVVKWISVMFQGSSATNYANELLHLHCALNYRYSAQTKRAVLSSWLVNTTGKDGGWIPTDLYQEHNNLLIKVVHSARASSTPWETMSTKIAPNIEIFAEVKKIIPAMFKTPRNKNWHNPVSADIDINKVIVTLRESGIFEAKQGDDDLDCTMDTKPVRDLFDTGNENICSLKKFREFRARNQSSNNYPSHHTSECGSPYNVNDGPQQYNISQYLQDIQQDELSDMDTQSICSISPNDVDYDDGAAFERYITTNKELELDAVEEYLDPSDNNEDQDDEDFDEL
ncbi:hypothetical protein BGZ54_002902 [Gamsiella multidivaricata]|nr:hypothetical protein BGZ54_002902 [Gamsiella multidivaricata]